MRDALSNGPEEEDAASEPDGEDVVSEPGKEDTTNEPDGEDTATDLDEDTVGEEAGVEGVGTEVGEEVDCVPDRSRLELVKGLLPEAAVEPAPSVPAELLVEEIGMGTAAEDVTRPDEEPVELASLAPEIKPEAPKPVLKAD